MVVQLLELKIFKPSLWIYKEIYLYMCVCMCVRERIKLLFVYNFFPDAFFKSMLFLVIIVSGRF